MIPDFRKSFSRSQIMGFPLNPGYLCRMQIYAADYAWLPDGIRANVAIETDHKGMITRVRDAVEDDEKLPGIITTGFVNAHCHLELSHLQGQIPKHTGMAGFVRKLQSIRNDFSEEERKMAAQNAADLMYAEGVSAVGDISNGETTLSIKRNHALKFHTFVELFGLDPGQAQDIYDRGESLLAQFPKKQASLTLHAPYSISAVLRNSVYERSRILEDTISVHLMESEEEIQLFRDHEGPLMDFLRDIGAPFQGYTYENPAAYLLNDNFRDDLRMNVDIPFLFVHNTEMDAATLNQLIENYHAWFVLCPNANEYIHGKLPDFRLFEAVSDSICLGTDSLAGNDRLDMVSEMRTIQQHYPDISTETLLDWACLNGAIALGLDEDLPCEIREGVPADLVVVESIDPNGLKFTADSISRRLTNLPA